MLSVRDIAHRLKKIDLLAGFDEESIVKLASSAQERHYIAGETIFLRGDKGDCFYVVVSGRVRIVLGVSDGREMTLRHQGPGTILGEIAMLDGRARSADAMALGPTSLRISRTHFMDIMERQPKLAQALLGALCARLRVLTDQVEAIALFPLETRLADSSSSSSAPAANRGPSPAYLRTSRRRNSRLSSWQAVRK